MRLALVLGTSLALLSTSWSPAADPTIDAVSSGYGGFSWSPSRAEVVPGGSVTFRSNSASVDHGVTWTGGPETPTCSGVPIDSFKKSWSGSCSFAQAGSYTFVCYVHPTEMKGTVTAAASTSTPPGTPTPGPGSPDPSPSGPVATGLKLAKSQQGGSVAGSIELLRTGSGSRLEVELTAGRARLFGPGKKGTARVGRIVRGSPPQGRFSFDVALRPAARNVLQDGGALPLTVTIKVTAADGEVFERTRGVVMRSPAS
jgi:plastocyanin